MRNRKLPMLWVKHREDAFRKTGLRHQRIDSSFEYADRDIFRELVEPARKRGMKTYARILDGGGQRALEGYANVLTRDIYGKPGTTACWNHPEYRSWWADSVADMFGNYALDGLQWGAERQGPLMNVILPWNDAAPGCFCQYCNARGRAHGIDPERARQGFEQLFLYTKTKHPDGAFTEFLRVLLRYPEILAWEYQY